MSESMFLYDPILDLDNVKARCSKCGGSDFTFTGSESRSWIGIGIMCNKCKYDLDIHIQKQTEHGKWVKLNES